jgi:pimeloyl-ACP methyl ester carboxylesterase
MPIRPRTARFLHSYLRGGRGAFREEETTLTIAGEVREATLYLPDRPARAPGWVVLHGLTVPGRRHLAMTRFVRSLAASGAVVLVPDVPSWRELRLDIEAARETLVSGALHLSEHPRVQAGGVGAIGFSFGATQALIAAADPRLHAALKAVVGFGGYANVERMIRAIFTGEHEWEGVEYRSDPDPYGRWVLAGNYLTLVPGHEHMHAVQDAALALAVEAGRRGAFAWEAEYDALKAEIRARLAPDEQPVWDLLAPPAGQPLHDLDGARRLAAAFAEGAIRRDPRVDPRPYFPALHGRVTLSHGRADRLIPFTESLRLAASLPPHLDASCTITGLFAHSAGASGLHPIARAKETLTFVRLLNRALYSV